jgi:hypothetical protein
MSFFHDEVIALFERACALPRLVPVPALVLLIWALAALTPDRALAGAINCSFIAVTPGNTAVTCTDGADVAPDGGLEIDLEDESVFLDSNDITPSPFDTEESKRQHRKR